MECPTINSWHIFVPSVASRSFTDDGIRFITWSIYFQLLYFTLYCDTQRSSANSESRRHYLCNEQLANSSSEYVSSRKSNRGKVYILEEYCRSDFCRHILDTLNTSIVTREPCTRLASKFLFLRIPELRSMYLQRRIDLKYYFVVRIVRKIEGSLSG